MNGLVCLAFVLVSRMVDSSVCPVNFNSALKGKFIENDKLCATLHPYPADANFSELLNPFLMSQVTCSSHYPGLVYSILSSPDRVNEKKHALQAPSDIHTYLTQGVRDFYNGVRIVDLQRSALSFENKTSMVIVYRTSDFNEQMMELTKNADKWWPNEFLGLSDKIMDQLYQGDFKTPICILMEAHADGIAAMEINNCKKVPSWVLCQVKSMDGCKVIQAEPGNWGGCECEVGFVGKRCEYKRELYEDPDAEDKELTKIIAVILGVLFGTFFLFVFLIRKRLMRKYQRRRERLKKLRAQRIKEGKKVDADLFGSMMSMFSTKK